jgi:hypothetical protein
VSFVHVWAVSLTHSFPRVPYCTIILFFAEVIDSDVSWEMAILTDISDDCCLCVKMLWQVRGHFWQYSSCFTNRIHNSKNRHSFVKRGMLLTGLSGSRLNSLASSWEYGNELSQSVTAVQNFFPLMIQW